MKLRNKQTGKIRDFEFVAISKDMDAEMAKYARHAPVLICRSIAELNEEWEDYKPTEPLLKNYPNEMEAIRAYGCSPLRFYRHARKGYSTFNFCTHFICFSRLFENLKDGETYTIAELCGDAPEYIEVVEKKYDTSIDVDDLSCEGEK